MYYTSGGTVKQANKRYNTTGHDYELTMRSDTGAKPRLNLNVVPLAMVSSRAGQCIDIIAIIDQVSELQQVQFSILIYEVISKMSSWKIRM
uniref:Helitron helicase n=1 Tax=Ascaris lumbricoides TaxID=6252 RepID=A0A0M3IWB6_ASCLU